MRRVVITGLGIVSCLGNNQAEVHQSLVNSKSGISYAEEYKEHNLKSHVHGKPNIKLEDHIDRKTIRFMGSGSAWFDELGLIASIMITNKRCSNNEIYSHIK